MPIVALSLPVSATASRAAGGFTVPGRAHLLDHLFGPLAEAEKLLGVQE